MKISQIGSIGVNRNNIKIRKSSYGKLKPLGFDIVNFGATTQPKHKPVQAYRCIGESEYKKLIAGEKVKSSGYISHEPMGWASEGWTNGFASKRNDVADVYFITFNYEKFAKDEIELQWNESKTITRAYSLDDIIDIRRGFNVHGELLWSKDFEKDKQEDVAEKKKRISVLLEKIKHNTVDSYDRSSIDELSSYVQEFPQIVSQLEQNTDFTNHYSVNSLADLITKTKDKRFLPEFRKCLKSFSEGIEAKATVLDFLYMHGDRNDLDDYMQIIDKNDFDSYFSTPRILYKLSTQEDYKRIIDRFNTQKPNDLSILSEFYTLIGSNGECLDEVHDLFEKCVKLYGSEIDVGAGLFSAITGCLSYFSSFGDKKSLAIMDSAMQTCHPEIKPRIERIKQSLEKKIR